MAYVNIAEWTSDQVADWLRGLESVLLPYKYLFVTKNIDGNRLLQLTSDDLQSMGITCIGHQGIILQGVELLKNIHFMINRENVQYLALQLSSKARSIYNQIRSSFESPDVSHDETKDAKECNGRMEDGGEKHAKERVSTAVLSGVTDVLYSVKILVSWLHRSPFNGIEHYDNLKSRLLDLSVKLATIALRDYFAENPVSVISDCCSKLAEEADDIIQNSRDPLILQPASLDVVTLKKRADDSWGMGLYSSYQGVHQISVLRALSPAHSSRKLMSGDQVVQVNYQTVVGWTSQKLAALMQENPVQVILTVKKCPSHVNTVTEIYFKPFRLPSKKRTYSPWLNSSANESRYELRGVPNPRFIKSYDGRTAGQRAGAHSPSLKSVSPLSEALIDSPSEKCDDPGTVTDEDSEDSNSDLDDAFISDDDGNTPTMASVSSRFFQPKPRPPIQRRATIPGALAGHDLPFDHLLQNYCHSLGESLQQDSFMLRTKGGGDLGLGRPRTFDGAGSKVGTHVYIKRHRRSNDAENKDLEEFESEETLCQTSPTNSNSISPISSPGAVDKLSRGRYDLVQRFKLDKSYSSPPYDFDCEDAVEETNKCESTLILPSRRITALKSTDDKTDDENNIEDPMNTSIDEESFKNETFAVSTPCEDVQMSWSSNASQASSFISNGQQETVPVIRCSVDESSFYDRQPKETRRISCRDLGIGDYHGWLYMRKESKSFLMSYRWEKRWFILKKSYLYGYRDREALKADSLVYLPGFYVYPASEIKVKRFAFKIYHSSGATFYFACDSSEERSRWMSQMGFSALSSVAGSGGGVPPPVNQQQIDKGNADVVEEPYFSETDEELEKSPVLPRPWTTTTHGESVKENQKTKIPLNSQSPSKVTPPSARRTSPLAAMPALRFLQSSKSALSQPMPTQNFRSYVRVREARVAPSESDIIPGVVRSTVVPAIPEEGLSGNNYSKQPGSSTSPKSKSREKDIQRKESFRDKLKNFSSLTLEKKKGNSVRHSSCSDQSHSGSPRLSNSDDARTESAVFSSTSEALVSRPPIGVFSPDSQGTKRRGSSNTSNPLSPSHSQKLTRLSPRKGSLDCLASKSLEFNYSLSRSNASSTSSLNAQEEYRGVTPENLWINSLRSNSRKSVEKQSPDKLKRAAHYQPFFRAKDDTMKMAFELTLSPEQQALSQYQASSNPKKALKRPQVPPRTKFLSPSERGIVSSAVTPTTSSPRSPHNHSTSPQEVCSPKTVKPAMGVPMIGKLKRSTGSLSPRDILPEYPGLEYPPTFEPESYTLNLLPLGLDLGSPDQSFKGNTSSVSKSESFTSPKLPEQSNFERSPILSGSQNDYINLAPNESPNQSELKYKQHVYVKTNVVQPEERIKPPAKPPRVMCPMSPPYDVSSPRPTPIRSDNVNGGGHRKSDSFSALNPDQRLSPHNEYIPMGSSDSPSYVAASSIRTNQPSRAPIPSNQGQHNTFTSRTWIGNDKTRNG